MAKWVCVQQATDSSNVSCGLELDGRERELSCLSSCVPSEEMKKWRCSSSLPCRRDLHSVWDSAMFSKGERKGWREELFFVRAG